MTTKEVYKLAQERCTIWVNRDDDQWDNEKLSKLSQEELDKLPHNAYNDDRWEDNKEVF